MPVLDIDAEMVAKAFVSTWVSRFVCPSIVTTDRGQQFDCTLFTFLNRLLGAKHCCTTAYDPCASGIVEWLHRQLKAVLTGRLHWKHWVDHLFMVLLCLRTVLRCHFILRPNSSVVLPLRFPGDLGVTSDPSPKPLQYLQWLQDCIKKLRSVSPQSSGSQHLCAP
ncbi:uncharacterized protein LOC142564468 [Dermacentor variabilis]|uniref:uncharacterized protein LOC142564468 n=1 Tax=Dermacentor variabilis TaxID=34621 RepID=UPI003F5BED77